MVIICPNCISSYRLNAEVARPSMARCAHCRDLFAVEPQLAMGHALDIRPEWTPQPAASRALRAIAAPMITQDVRIVRPLRPPAARARGERSAARPAIAMLACLGLVMAGVAFRDRIAQAMPAAPSMLGFADDSLRLDGVTTALADEGNTKVLTLEGRITNDRASPAAVPDLRIVVRDGGAQSLYSWTTPSPRANLAPGEGVAFRSRLVSPPGEGHDIVVSFAESTGDSRIVRVKGQP